MALDDNGHVSVVVVSYHSASTIETCLRSARADAALRELIVVDNASEDGTVSILRSLVAEGLQVRIIENAENRGFGAACNQAAATACGSYLLFLNPDAFPPADAITELARHLDREPEIGLIGCLMVSADDRPCGPQRRREPTWRRSLMTMTGLARFEQHSRWFEGVELPLPEMHDIVIDADAVNGAAMLLPRTVFEQIGGFDEGFVLHAEDLDLCRRIRDAGWRIAVATDVTMRHIGGVSSRRRPIWVEWQKTRSLWRYFRKHEQTVLPIRVLVAGALVVRLGFKLSGRFAKSIVQASVGRQ